MSENPLSMLAEDAVLSVSRSAIERAVRILSGLDQKVEAVALIRAALAGCGYIEAVAVINDLTGFVYKMEG